MKNLQVPSELHAKLLAYSKESGISMTRLTQNAVRLLLKSIEEKK